MRRGKNNNLFRKYFFLMSMVILLSFVILGSALLFFVSRSWLREREELLRQNVQSVAATTSELVSSGYMRQNESGSVLLICNTLALLSDSVDADIFIVDTEGKVIYCQELLRENMVIMPGLCPVHAGYTIADSYLKKAVENDGFQELTALNGIYDTPYLVVAKPIAVESSVIGIVFAAQPIAGSLGVYLLSILRMFGFASIVALIIAFLTVYYMVYRITAPLRQMSKATKLYAAGDFSYRITVKGNDELAQLAEGFNNMAKDLAILESSRRNFVANVSHELKTPMTTIGGFIDGILDGTIKEDKREQYLQTVSEEIKRLSRLVTSMLNMSKIEAGELTINPSRFDIAEMIFKTLLSFEQVIEKRGIQLQGLENLQSLFVTADEDMINQVVYNLLDNAVKFTPDFGTIVVTVYSDKTRAVVKIGNTGPGISSEDIGRIFERFYKVDKARSFGTQGSGLGLCIVKSILDMHGGTIGVKSVENGLTEFAFTLPLQ